MIGMIEAVIVLLAVAAALNLARAQASPLEQIEHWTIYESRDRLYVVERPSGWEYRTKEDSNETIFRSGNVSVSVAVANNDKDNSVGQFLEANNEVVPVFRTVFAFSLVEVLAFVFRLPWILAGG